MNKKNLVFVLFFLFSLLFFGQENTVNEYLPDNFDSMKDYLHAIKSKQINSIKGPYASKIKKVYADQEMRMPTAIGDSVYFFNSGLKSHLDGVLNSIYTPNKNYIDPQDYYFFIKNSIIPNAGCYGDGTFEITLGLFTTYTSDDELAFVICHEIAHDILEHSYKKISTVVATLNSNRTKDKIRSIEKQKYGQTRAGLALIDTLSTDLLQHAKEVEAQADSLGFVLFQNTNYNSSLAIRALEKLKITDGTYFDFPVQLDSLFNYERYPFKDYWLKEALSIFDTTEKINDFRMASESEKTHPEIDFRIQKIKNDFSFPTQVKEENSHITPIKKIAAIQSIKYTIDLKLLDLAMYQLIREYALGKIDDTYYYATMANVFIKIYNAKKNHELGKYVPRKNNFSDEKELNRIRLFLHNLELDEVRKIGFHFCQESLRTTDSNESINQSIKFFKT